MKIRIALLSLFTLLISFSGFDLQAQINGKIDSVGYVDNAPGKIVVLASNFFIQRIDKSSRYMPIFLDDEFKQEGLEVTFSGVVGKIPPNVRLMGTPFLIRKIELKMDDNKGPIESPKGETESSEIENTQPEIEEITEATDIKSTDTENTEAMDNLTTTTEADRTVTDLKGKIQKIDDERFLIVLASEKKYYPSNLEDKFKEDGKEVEFSGVEGVIPPNVRMLGTPLKITSMKAVSSKKWWKFWKWFS